MHGIIQGILRFCSHHAEHGSQQKVLEKLVKVTCNVVVFQRSDSCLKFFEILICLDVVHKGVDVNVDVRLETWGEVPNGTGFRSSQLIVFV